MKQKILQIVFAAFVCMGAHAATTNQYVLQPGISDSKDIWTTSDFSYAACSSPGPGGGLNDYRLRVGGWGDSYYSLMQFDLTGLPTNAISAVLYLYCENLSGGGTPIYLDQITQAWDWRTSGTGCDHDRLWWADKPLTTQWLADQLPTPTEGQWYAVDITDLYNAWQNGTYPNYGLQFRPVLNSDNNFDEFYSGDYTNDPTLRPKLVIAAVGFNPFSPHITAPPQSQTAQAGSNVIFTVVASGALPFLYQWQFNRQNIPNATNAILTLNSVTAANSGGYFVVVSNPYGSATSTTASLAVLDDGANGNQPTQIDVSPAPLKLNGSSSLIFVTHGWQPKEFNPSGPPSQPWMVEMTNAIAQQLVASGQSSDWQVEAYYWLQDSWTEDPNTALNNAKNIGTLVGKQIAAQGWQSVHLIAHSAGAELIQAITDQLSLSTNPPIVQETFLDPFTGRFLEGRGQYGLKANWADDYFAIDSDTDLAGVLLANFPGSTSGQLTWAYNVDVGGTLEAALPTQYIVGNGTAGSTPPVYISPSHGSSIDFYNSTIDSTAPSCATDYGFSLSAEAGGSGNWPSHSRNNPPVPLCGMVSFSQNQQPIRSDAPFIFSLVPNGTSSSGVSFLGNNGASLSSGLSSQASVKSSKVHPLDNPVNSSAWFAIGVTVTNEVDSIQFDAGFTIRNAAQGLLTVYWNTNQVGVVDERVAEINLQTYRFTLPVTVTDGIYSLSFRLDSFSSTSSSVAVTNVSTGFVGVTQPITLGISLTNGAPLLQLTATTNFTYLIQNSTNLVDWAPTVLILNTNGTVQFLDSAITNSKAIFYRALMP